MASVAIETQADEPYQPWNAEVDYWRVITGEEQAL